MRLLLVGFRAASCAGAAKSGGAVTLMPIRGPDGKESAFSAGDPGLISGLGRSPGEGDGNPRQYSCLGNLMDRGAWQTTVHGVAKSQNN